MEEDTSIRGRMRSIFKNYVFTVSVVVLAVGATIGVIVRCDGIDKRPEVCCRRSWR